MHLLRAALALLAGLVTGSAVNMALVVVGSSLVGPHAGGDTTTVEGLRTSMHLLEPKHFVVPFMAHALGTFAGALAGSLLAGSRRGLPAHGVAGADRQHEDQAGVHDRRMESMTPGVGFTLAVQTPWPSWSC